MATSLSTTTCMWDWCTRSFPDLSSLKVHVELDHIANAVPVRRKDVPLLRRAEDGTSLQESALPREWISDSGGSQSLIVSNRVERAVMTDPIPTATNVGPETPKRVSPSRSDGSEKPHTPRALPRENVQMTFAEMRGTPSPAPSNVPSSPGTSAIISKMKHNTLFPVSRRSPNVTHSTTPRTPFSKPNSRSTPLRESSKARHMQPFTLLTPPVGDDGADEDSKRAAGTADPDASMEVVESQLLSLDETDDAMVVKSESQNVLHSQWQPQSQLPLPGSLENSTFPMSTVDPNQLHAPLPYTTNPQPMFQIRRDSILFSPPIIIASDVERSSRDPGTPQPSSSAPAPPSPSTLDISHIATTDSQESILFTPRKEPPGASQSSAILQALPAPTTSLSDAEKVASSQSQETGLYLQEVPFSDGYGYGYGDRNVESQPLQTQAPLQQSSLDSFGWSQG